jgi:hypothetical protein
MNDRRICTCRRRSRQSSPSYSWAGLAIHYLAHGFSRRVVSLICLPRS